VLRLRQLKPFEILLSAIPFKTWILTLFFLPPIAEGLATFFNMTLLYIALKWLVFEFPIPFFGKIVIPLIPNVEQLKNVIYGFGLVISILCGFQVRKVLEEKGVKYSLAISMIFSGFGYVIPFIASEFFGLETYMIGLLNAIYKSVKFIVANVLANEFKYIITAIVLGVLSGFTVNLQLIFLSAFLMLIVWFIEWVLLYAASKISHAFVEFSTIFFESFRHRPMSGFFLLTLFHFAGGLVYISILILVIKIALAYIFGFVIGFIISLPIGIILGIITGIVSLISYFMLSRVEKYIGRVIINPFKAANISSEALGIVVTLIILTLVHFIFPKLLQFFIYGIIAYVISLMAKVAYNGLPKKIKTRAAILSGIATFVTLLVISYLLINPDITNCINEYLAWKMGYGINHKLFCIQCASVWKELSQRAQDIIQTVKNAYCIECVKYMNNDIVRYLMQEIFKC